MICADDVRNRCNVSMSQCPCDARDSNDFVCSHADRHSSAAPRGCLQSCCAPSAPRQQQQQHQRTHQQTHRLQTQRLRQAAAATAGVTMLQKPPEPPRTPFVLWRLSCLWRSGGTCGRFSRQVTAVPRGLTQHLCWLLSLQLPLRHDWDALPAVTTPYCDFSRMHAHAWMPIVPDALFAPDLSAVSVNCRRRCGLSCVLRDKRLRHACQLRSSSLQGCWRSFCERYLQL